MLSVLVVLSGCDGRIEAPRSLGVGTHLAMPTVTVSGGEPILAVTKGEPLPWEVSPSTLRVLKDTEVTLKVEAPDGLTDAARFEWSLGADLGTQTTDGPTLTTVVPAGFADRFVTLAIFEGDELVHKSTRKLPIERIPPAPGALAEVTTTPLPAKESPSTMRIAVVSDLGEADVSQIGVIEAALVSVIQPSMVVVLGNGLTGEGAGDRLDALVVPLSTAGIDVIPVRGSGEPLDAFEGFWKDTKHQPALDLVDGAHYPSLYSFEKKGTFVAVLDSAGDEMPEATLKWLNRELNASTVHPVRLVFSSKPLHKLTAEDLGTAGKPFRIYEALNRTKASLLVTGHNKIYFHGVYGSIPVLTAGAVAGQCQIPTGGTTCQEHTIAVIDITDGAVSKVFAAVAPDYTTMYPDSLLPATIEEVYKQK